jgi:hypothetical protein
MYTHVSKCKSDQIKGEKKKQTNKKKCKKIKIKGPQPAGNALCLSVFLPETQGSHLEVQQLSVSLRPDRATINEGAAGNGKALSWHGNSFELLARTSHLVRKINTLCG